MENLSGDPIERLFSVYSHELRTPITSLQVALELLQSYRDQPDPEEVGELLNLAVQSADRLTRAIEMILDWYELTHKSDVIFKQSWDLVLLIADVVRQLRFLADRERIRIELDLPDSLLLNVDYYYLSRALSYLVHNAIKCSPPDSEIGITVTAGETRDFDHLSASPSVLIAIKDRGRGIPETALELIFQPFQRVDSSGSRSHGGLGLELAICQKIVRQHGGKIWAESIVGRGSIFYVALPMIESTHGNR